MQAIYKILRFVFTGFKHGLRLAKAVADVTTVPPPPTAVKEEDAWNSNPTLLMAGAFIMLIAFKQGSRHKPSGSLVQQGRSTSLKYIRLVKAPILTGTII